MPTSLGPAELLVVLIVALIVLGPKKLPEAGRQVGKAIAEVRKWSQGFQDEIKNVMEPEAGRPSYSQPQPGYRPPVPVTSTQTEPPAESNGHSTVTDSHADGTVADSHTDGTVTDSHADGTVTDSHADGTVADSHAQGAVTTGSHGMVSEPPPADTPAGNDPSGPPSGDTPQS